MLHQCNQPNEKKMKRRKTCSKGKVLKNLKRDDAYFLYAFEGCILPVSYRFLYHILRHIRALKVSAFIEHCFAEIAFEADEKSRSTATEAH